MIVTYFLLAVTSLMMVYLQITGTHRPSPVKKNLDGWEKNVEVMRSNWTLFKRIDQENIHDRRVAVTSREWGRYVHKLHATVTDYIRYNYRLLGYQLYPAFVNVVCLALLATGVV